MLTDIKDPEVLAKELALLTHTVFETAAGKKLLEYWIETHVMGPVAPPNYPESYARYVEGQNAFIRSIMNSIKMHKNPELFKINSTQEVKKNG